MTKSYILGRFKNISEQQLLNGFDSIKRKLALSPIMLGVSAVNVTMLGLCNSAIYIDGQVCHIKEVKEIMCETPVYDETEIDTDREGVSSVQFSFTPVKPSGKVYYNSNYFKTDTATFNLVAYIYPSIVNNEIPDFMAIPTIIQALALSKLDDGDVQGHTQYQDIAYKLVNHINTSFIKLMPKGFDSIGTGEAYDL